MHDGVIMVYTVGGNTFDNIKCVLWLKIQLSTFQERNCFDIHSCNKNTVSLKPKNTKHIEIAGAFWVCNGIDSYTFYTTDLPGTWVLMERSDQWLCQQNSATPLGVGYTDGVSSSFWSWVPATVSTIHGGISLSLCTCNSCTSTDTNNWVTSIKLNIATICRCIYMGDLARNKRARGGYAAWVVQDKPENYRDSTKSSPQIGSKSHAIMHEKKTCFSVNWTKWKLTLENKMHSCINISTFT